MVVVSLDVVCLGLGPCLRRVVLHGGVEKVVEMKLIVLVRCLVEV